MLLQLNNKNVRLNSLIDGVVFRLKSYCSYSGIITVYIDFMAIISVSLHISMFGCGFIIELRHFKVNKSKIHRYSDLVAVDVLCYFFFYRSGRHSRAQKHIDIHALAVMRCNCSSGSSRNNNTDRTATHLFICT